MSYQVLKLIVYVFSVLSAMYGLSCFHYEKYILKGKLQATGNKKAVKNRRL